MSSLNGYALVRNRNEVYDANGLKWDAMTQPGGSTGGGGDASAANQVTGNNALAALFTELQLKADLLETQPVSLASVPSHPVTNAGTFPVQAAATLAAETTKVIGTVNIAAGQTVTTSRPTTATRTSVPAANADTALLAANASRYGATIHNDADKTLFLALGTAAASASSFTTKVLAGGYYETPFTYTGAIRGFWDVTPTGNARCTEVT